MKIKNTLLLIVTILLTLWSVNAQYIENDTRFEDGPVNATRAIPTTMSIENEIETMTITDTSAETKLLDATPVTTSTEIDEMEMNDKVEAISIGEEVMNYNLMYWIAWILFVLVTLLLINKNYKLKNNKD